MKNVLVPSSIALLLGLALACGGETAAPPPPTTGGSTGVAECDEYITKMEACISSMDPTTKAQYEAAFKSTRDAWTQAAATPAGKDGLKMGCTAALTSMPPTCGGTAATPSSKPPLGDGHNHGTENHEPRNNQPTNNDNARSPSLEELRKNK